MKNNKETQFKDLYQNYYRKSFLFAKSYIHDSWAAEDITSEALISLWEILKKNEIHHPLTFLFSIIRNKCIDYLRHELVRQETLSTLSEVGLRELNTSRRKSQLNLVNDSSFLRKFSYHKRSSCR